MDVTALSLIHLEWMSECHHWDEKNNYRNHFLCVFYGSVEELQLRKAVLNVTVPQISVPSPFLISDYPYYLEDLIPMTPKTSISKPQFSF